MKRTLLEAFFFTFLINLLTASILFAALPPLIPREVLFGNPVKAGAQISPDGTRLAYVAPSDKGVLNVWVRTIGKEDDIILTDDTHQGIYQYKWAYDNRHILYFQDRSQKTKSVERHEKVVLTQNSD